MDNHHQRSSAPTAAIVIVAVLVLAIVLLGGCALVGFMFYRTTTRKETVAREHAMRAQAQAQEIAVRERERAEQLARAAESARADLQTRLAARQEGRPETATATVTPKVEPDATVLQIAIDAEGRMSVDGEAMDWEQVNERLQGLSSHAASRVIILADPQCRMEPILKLLRAAEVCSVEATIDASPVEADESG